MPSWGQTQQRLFARHWHSFILLFSHYAVGCRHFNALYMCKYIVVLTIKLPCAYQKRICVSLWQPTSKQQVALMQESFSAAEGRKNKLHNCRILCRHDLILASWGQLQQQLFSALKLWFSTAKKKKKGTDLKSGPPASRGSHGSTCNTINKLADVQISTLAATSHLFSSWFIDHFKINDEKTTLIQILKSHQRNSAVYLARLHQNLPCKILLGFAVSVSHPEWQ